MLLTANCWFGQFIYIFVNDIYELIVDDFKKRIVVNPSILLCNISLQYRATKLQIFIAYFRIICHLTWGLKLLYSDECYSWKRKHLCLYNNGRITHLFWHTCAKYSRNPFINNPLNFLTYIASQKLWKYSIDD